MKKLVITILLSLGIGASALAQQTEHQVKRGETFASIAAKYGITEAALRKANADKKTAYAGLKLRIPVSKVTSKSVASDTTVPSSKPAVQPFSPTTEYSDNSNSLANFNKGKDYFYNKKWKKAIKAFNDVLSDPLADENTKQQSQQFLVQAQNQQQERKERREAFWNMFSTSLKTVGNTLTEVSNTIQEQEKRRREISNGQNQMGAQTASNQQDVDNNYNNGIYQSSYPQPQGNQTNSSIHKEKPKPTKTCSWCNGTGKTPVGRRGQYSKWCDWDFYNSNHVCRKEQCLICHHTHCIEMSHKTCKTCKGKGKTF